MFKLLYPLVQAIQPFLVPVCFFCAWMLILLLFWSFWATMRDGYARAKRMHEIPCNGCQFFTNDYRLKCTVHPQIANSEAAINCRDYQPLPSYYTTGNYRA